LALVVTSNAAGMVENVTRHAPLSDDRCDPRRRRGSSLGRTPPTGRAAKVQLNLTFGVRTGE